MTTFHFKELVLLTLSVASGIGSRPATAAAWEYRDFAKAPYHSVEAVLSARDHRAILAINCSHAGDPTISIQYRPHPDIGLSMAPVILDWDPPHSTSLASKLIWEPHDRGTAARDGIDDRDASDAAEAIRATSGVLKVLTADIGGDRSEAYFDSDENREAIGRVLAACRPTPTKSKPRAK